MRILYIASKLDQFGGIEKYNRNLINALEKFDINISIVERRIGGLFAKASFLVRVFISAIFKRPDFIICTHLHFSPICYFLKIFFGLNYSISIYGIEAPYISSRLYKKPFLRAQSIIYLFDGVAKNIIDKIPEIENRLFKIPNSIDGEVFKIKERSTELISKFQLKGSKTILTLGRMSKLDGENKGYRRVILAVKKVVEQIPNVKYLLVGGGDDVDDVRNFVKNLDLEDYVIVASAPSNNELVEYYNLGDIFVLPSKNEGFPPIVILEALACGIPVIGGNQFGADEALMYGKLGLIVPHDDIDAISDGIIKILKTDGGINTYNRDELRSLTLQKYGHNAYINAVSNFISSIKK